MDQRSRFERWTSPDEFGEAYRAAAPQDGADFYGRSGNAWLRDACVAHDFARLARAAAVRLIPRPAERPDFEVQSRDGIVSAFEVIAALRPGDEPAKRWKQWKSEGYPLLQISQKEIEERETSLPHAVRAAADSKIAQTLKRPYPDGTGLVIYVNVGGFNWSGDQAERDRIVVDNAAHAREHFDSVWALYGGRLLRC